MRQTLRLYHTLQIDEFVSYVSKSNNFSVVVLKRTPPTRTLFGPMVNALINLQEKFSCFSQLPEEMLPDESITKMRSIVALGHVTTAKKKIICSSVNVGSFSNYISKSVCVCVHSNNYISKYVSVCAFPSSNYIIKSVCSF